MTSGHRTRDELTELKERLPAGVCQAAGRTRQADPEDDDNFTLTHAWPVTIFGFLSEVRGDSWGREFTRRDPIGNLAEILANDRAMLEAVLFSPAMALAHVQDSVGQGAGVAGAW